MKPYQESKEQEGAEGFFLSTGGEDTVMCPAPKHGKQGLAMERTTVFPLTCLQLGIFCSLLLSSFSPITYPMWHCQPPSGSKENECHHLDAADDCETDLIPCTWLVADGSMLLVSGQSSMKSSSSAQLEKSTTPYCSFCRKGGETRGKEGGSQTCVRQVNMPWLCALTETKTEF